MRGQNAIPQIFPFRESGWFSSGGFEEVEGYSVFMTRLAKVLVRLPRRFRWTLHNVVAHPLMEVLYQLGYSELSERVHDRTQPPSEDGETEDSPGTSYPAE